VTKFAPSPRRTRSQKRKAARDSTKSPLKKRTPSFIERVCDTEDTSRSLTPVGSIDLQDQVGPYGSISGIISADDRVSTFFPVELVTPLTSVTSLDPSTSSDRLIIEVGMTTNLAWNG